jgi:hypothetical protein
VLFSGHMIDARAVRNLLSADKESLQQRECDRKHTTEVRAGLAILQSAAGHAAAT